MQLRPMLEMEAKNKQIHTYVHELEIQGSCFDDIQWLSIKLGNDQTRCTSFAVFDKLKGRAGIIDGTTMHLYQLLNMVL